MVDMWNFVTVRFSGCSNFGRRRSFDVEMIIDKLLNGKIEVVSAQIWWQKFPLLSDSLLEFEYATYRTLWGSFAAAFSRPAESP